MRALLISAALTSVALFVAPVASAQDVDLHQNDAVHIVFPTDLRADVNYPGDPFFVTVDHDPLLPDGARLYGHIQSIHMASRRRPASMQLEFDTLALPHGPRYHIAAIPTKLDDPHLQRGANGRLVAQYKPGDAAGYTIGGAAAGLLVGGLIHRPFTGTFLGAIIGSIAGSEDRRENQNLVVAKGERMAAVFQQDVTRNDIETGPPIRTPVYRGGWHTNERFHRMRPTTMDSEIEIRDGDHALTFDQAAPPFRDGGEVLVPLDKTAGQLQVDVTQHSDGRITLEGPNGSIEIRRGANDYKMDNGQSGTLQRMPAIRNGVTFVPLEVFAAVSSDHITLNGSPVEWITN